MCPIKRNDRLPGRGRCFTVTITTRTAIVLLLLLIVLLQAAGCVLVGDIAIRYHPHPTTDRGYLATA